MQLGIPQMLVNAVFDPHQLFMRSLFSHLSVAQHDDEVYRREFAFSIEGICGEDSDLY